MDLAKKLLLLRKKSGMSQEDLAEKLNVSRQTISKWENSSSQPDLTNIIQISKIFSVSVDYLVKDELEIEAENFTKNKDIKKEKKNILAYILFSIGALGNFIIYILSRIIKVVVPVATYDSEGNIVAYRCSGDYKAINYKYFIENYKLEFLVLILFIFIIIAIILLFKYKLKFKNKSN